MAAVSAERAQATDRSLLSLAKGASTEAEFRLSCNWINDGAVTVETDPDSVPGEIKIDNNLLTESCTVGACS